MSRWRATPVGVWGGKADQLFIADSVEDLQAFLHTLPVGEPVHFIGLGSNFTVYVMAVYVAR